MVQGAAEQEEVEEVDEECSGMYGKGLNAIKYLICCGLIGWPGTLVDTAARARAVLYCICVQASLFSTGHSGPSKKTNNSSSIDVSFITPVVSYSFLCIP